jgi:hypothetical protein
MGIKFLFSLNHHQSMKKEFYPQELWLRHFPLQFSIFHSRIEREVLDIYSFFSLQNSDMYQTTRSRREILSSGLRCPQKQPLIGKLISCHLYKNGI